jgi:hypothetical protein
MIVEIVVAQGFGQVDFLSQLRWLGSEHEVVTAGSTVAQGSGVYE